ncbi:MAG: hypothetical protein JXL97_11235 [Bacteroidales bacterium]|nr:hypothetical protein [Bacteroidales bacterium]
MKVIIAPKFVKFITMGFASAITLFPYVFVSSKKNASDKILLNHEKIHLKQQKDFFIIPFYLLYAGSYFTNLVKYKNHKKAYLNIPFEKEAYNNQDNLNYLKKTGKMGWLFRNRK